jgi:hypothetical protein
MPAFRAMATLFVLIFQGPGATDRAQCCEFMHMNGLSMPPTRAAISILQLEGVTRKVAAMPCGDG